VWFPGGVPALRCLIDSMVFDAVVAEPELSREIDRLTSARRLELLAAAETMREVGRTPDRAHRRRLQRVRVLVVAPAVPGDAAAPEELHGLLRSPGVSDEDTRIALAAAVQGVPLVTEDRDLRAAVAAHLPRLRTWTWGSELRPRILGLAAEHPPVARRR
jgi:predicted nucleic acid-binding protein